VRPVLRVVEAPPTVVDTPTVVETPTVVVIVVAPSVVTVLDASTLSTTIPLEPAAREFVGSGYPAVGAVGGHVANPVRFSDMRQPVTLVVTQPAVENPLAVLIPLPTLKKMESIPVAVL